MDEYIDRFGSFTVVEPGIHGTTKVRNLRFNIKMGINGF